MPKQTDSTTNTTPSSSKWISVKEQLPPLGQLVDLYRKGIGTIPKVKLTKEFDEDLRDGFCYEWRYKSGIFAAPFDREDEWHYWEKLAP